MREVVHWGTHIGCLKSRWFFSKGLQVQILIHDRGELSGKFEIVLDGNTYLDAVLQMPLPSTPLEALLNASDTKLFRTVARSIGYTATAFRPEMSAQSSVLGRTFITPTQKDAKKANAVIAFAKSRRFVLRFRPGIKQLLVFADSSGPNEE